MLEKIIKDYFSFSKKERVAVILLVLLIITIASLPYLFPAAEKSAEVIEMKRFQANAGTEALSNDADKPVASRFAERSRFRESLYDRPAFKGNGLPQKFSPFYFDPNNLSPEGWKKLGIRERTIITINNYLQKGGKFKRKEDIQKIYGLHPDEVARLLPYVRISVSDTFARYEQRTYPFQKNENKEKPTWTKAASPPKIIDLNSADSSDFESLPGIGPKLSARIIHFRERLGGFYAVQQVSEVYGLPDSTYEKIRPQLTVGSPLSPTININTVGANELKQHPYLKWNIATAIIEFRKQHGNFQHLEDLRQIELVTADLYQKVLPYLKLD